MDLMSMAVALSGNKLWLTSMCRHETVCFIITDCTVWEIQRVDGHSLYTIISCPGADIKFFVNIHFRRLKWTITGNAYNNLCDFCIIYFAVIQNGPEVSWPFNKIHSETRRKFLYYLSNVHKLFEIRFSMLQAQLSMLWYHFTNGLA